MVQKRRWVGALMGLFILAAGSLMHMACLAPYFYDRDGHRVWRDGHDDDWHRSHGDHWDENHPDDHHDNDNH